jgi:signal transduction histidine kinase
MNANKPMQRIYKLFTLWTLGLCVSGLLVNTVLAGIVNILGLPLYIDNVGSVLVAALGGPIPGMTVGFLSNLINSATDPISMYYGILTILNALAAAWFSRKGYLKTISGCFWLAMIMVVIGGAGGSIMTWTLYGAEIGGLAAPLANIFYANGCPKFWAQFSADVLLDIPDKLITMLPVYLFLNNYPKALYDKFMNSYLYDRNAEEIRSIEDNERTIYTRKSVSRRITELILLSSLLISGISIFVGIRYYQEELRAKYFEEVTNVSSLAAACVDGNMVDAYLSQGEQAADYTDTEKKLDKILHNMKQVQYLYVYQIQEDGSHVVFDCDTQDVEGDEPGSIVTFDESFSDCQDILIAGGTIDARFTHDSYGWMITAFTPIKDDMERTTAYACADIPMENYMRDMFIFIIKMLSMLFGISLFVSSFALWYAAMRISGPINSIVEQTREFNRVTPELWLESPQWKNREAVKTGDEIESLYNTVSSVQENISQNVVKMKQAEQQLRDSYELEKKNKKLALEVRRADEENALKTEFYSRMSHDMRTPMNGILGLVNLSKEETDIQVLKDNLDKIEVSSNYLLALINDTLDMSKIETKKMQIEKNPICIQNLIQGIADMLRPTLEQKQQQFQLDISKIDENLCLLMDEVRVKQIIMNLMSNAMKFTPAGGMISLKIEEKGKVQKDGKTIVYYRIVLQDTGCGMSEEFMQDKIFKPFSQEQNNITITSAGSGLGLSIVKNLVELMGGHITVNSELGEGTVFTIELGFEVSDEVISTEKEYATEDYSVLCGRRVLLCEDHPLNKEIMIRLLEKIGVVVDYAENGEVGVRRFKDSTEDEYLAILMDIRMPVMDGIEAARCIRGLERADSKRVPIVAMTANAYAEDKKMTKAAGMDAHLTKPVDVTALYQTLMKYV